MNPSPNSAALVCFDSFRVMTKDTRTIAAANMGAFQKKELMLQQANSDNNTTNIFESINDTASLSESKIQSLGLFVGVNDGIHNAEGTAIVVPLKQEDTKILISSD